MSVISSTNFLVITKMIHDELKGVGFYLKSFEYLVETLNYFIPQKYKNTKDTIDEIVSLVDKFQENGFGEVAQDSLLRKIDVYANDLNIPQDDAELLTKCLFSALKEKDASKELKFVECASLNPINFIKELENACAIIKYAVKDVEQQMQTMQSIVAQVSKTENGLEHFAEHFSEVKTKAIDAAFSNSTLVENCSHIIGANFNESIQTLNCYVNSSKAIGISQKLQNFLHCKEITTSYKASVILHNTMSLVNCIENQTVLNGECSL